MTIIEQIAVPGAGLNLVADVAGPVGGVSVLFLHGSGQTRQSWRSAVTAAARRGYRAYAPDLRGHGDSDWAPDGQYGLDRFAADVRRVIEYLGTVPVLVGASLGGLAGLLVAAAPPPAVRALVLVDITPRVEMRGAREVIAFMDSAPDGYASLEDAANAVAAYLPHRERPKNINGLLRNLRLRDGRYYWHWDPAFMQIGREVNAKHEAGESDADHADLLGAAARRISEPTLLIRGGRSRMVSDEGVREFLEMVPHAEVVDISDADHMVAGDANDAFNDAIFRFIDRQLLRTN